MPDSQFNSARHQTANKAFAASGQKPLDAKSMYYDSDNFVYRAYVSVAEALSFIPSAQRVVGLMVLVNSGGSLSAGVITGGTNELYIFKDGIADGNLVRLNAGPSKEVVTDASTLQIDCKNYKHHIINLGTVRGISFNNNNPDLDYHILQVKHTVAGTVINLPGSNNIIGNWAENLNDTTFIACVWDGTSWTFELTVLLAAATGLPTLDTPTSFTATAGDGSLLLDWNDVANATGYVVTRATDAGFTANVSNTTISSPTSQATLTGLTNGTLYYLRVKATAAGYTDSGWASAQGTPAAAGGSYDVDAQAFFTAAGITNTTQKDAVDDLVVALKAGTLWGKMKAIYPFVGGSASAHKFNLKNPLDTDAAFRIEWGGTVTHNANGITGDGSSGYADTKLVPDTVFSNKNNLSHFAYNRTNADGRLVMGTASGAGIMQIVPKFSGSGYFAAGTNQSSGNITTNSDATGCYIVSRTGDAILKVFKNGIQLGTTETTTNPPTTLLTQPINLLCEMANTTRSNFVSLNVALYGVADGLSDSEATELNTAIVNFQTALGRNV